MRHRMSALALAITLAGVLVVVLGGVPAGATTGNSVGLTKPKVTVPARDIDPILGRFFLSEAPRGSRLISAQLDIAPQQAGEWFYGEMLLHLYARGKPSTVLIAVYSFEYSEGGQELSAELVPAGTVTLAHPYGVSAGRIVFDLPLKDMGLGEARRNSRWSTARSR